MRKAHFLFSKWRQVAKATGNFCFAKSSHGSNAVGRCVARHHRCRKFCFAEVSPAGGEIPKRRRTRAAIRGFGTNPFLLWQTLRSRIAAEKNSVKRNFAKPLLLSLRLHAQRKSGQTFLCNFYLMCLLSTTSNNRSGGCSAPPGPFDQRAARP